MHKRIHTPHNAHIGARLKSAREALREHLEAEESVRLHDAHVETRRAAFLLLSDTTNSVQHARDFTSHIKKTKFAQAHPYKVSVARPRLDPIPLSSEGVHHF